MLVYLIQYSLAPLGGFLATIIDEGEKGIVSSLASIVFVAAGRLSGSETRNAR